MSTRFFRWQDLHVAVDVSPQVLRLEMAPIASWDAMGQRGKRRLSESEIRSSKFAPDERFEGPLDSSIAAVLAEGPFVSASMLAQKASSGGLDSSLILAPFVSASMLAQKARAVDDGIVAALEFFLDEGAASFPGRAALLHDGKACSGMSGIDPPRIRPKPRPSVCSRQPGRWPRTRTPIWRTGPLHAGFGAAVTRVILARSQNGRCRWASISGGSPSRS